MSQQSGNHKTLCPQARFHPHPQVMSQRLGNETVLIHLRSDRIFQLNDTGTRIWELMETGQDLATIQQKLLEDYDIEAVKLNQEIADLLAVLMLEELVVAQ